MKKTMAAWATATISENGTIMCLIRESRRELIHSVNNIFVTPINHGPITKIQLPLPVVKKKAKKS